MSVYAPSGSGGVHVDTVMGGGKRVPPKPAMKKPVAKKASAKKPVAKKGMGFPAAASAAGGGKKGAAIVAAATQKASPAAKAANPSLKKVPTKGSTKKPGGTYSKGGSKQ